MQTIKLRNIKYWLLALLSLSSVAVSAGIKVDKAAPNFQLTNSQGKTVSLSDFSGKHVILEWTNHLCPYVKKHYDSDNMQALQRK